MITRTNNIQNQNTFGMKTRFLPTTRIDEKFIEKAPEYLNEILGAMERNNRAIDADHEANKAVADILSLSLRDNQHLTNTARTVEMRVKFGEKAEETITHVFSNNEIADESIKKLSGYLDRATDFDFSKGIAAKIKRLQNAGSEASSKPHQNIFARIWNAIWDRPNN